MRNIILMAVGAALCAVPAAGVDEDTATLQAIGIGRGIYLTNCTECHGTDARGTALAAPRDGEATRGPDLTAIELRDGRFDSTRVKHYIAGEPWRGCTSDMPCWQKFMGRGSWHTEAYAHQQISTLVRYLQFAQRKSP